MNRWRCEACGRMVPDQWGCLFIHDDDHAEWRAERLRLFAEVRARAIARVRADQ